MQKKTVKNQSAVLSNGGDQPISPIFGLDFGAVVGPFVIIFKIEGRAVGNITPIKLIGFISAAAYAKKICIITYC